jgi:hypothetical protein
MSKALIVNGVSYDIPSNKIQYIIDTQFNYFKFPPRIKNITPTDAIKLDDAINLDEDLISARYSFNSDTGVVISKISDLSVNRAGIWNDENVDEISTNDVLIVGPGPTVYQALAKYPNGYTVYRPGNTVSLSAVNQYNSDKPGWVLPSKLQLDLTLDGYEFIKPGTFIVTPEMIALGENIFFDIQVDLQVRELSIAQGGTRTVPYAADSFADASDPNQSIEFDSFGRYRRYTNNPTRDALVVDNKVLIELRKQSPDAESPDPRQTGMWNSPGRYGQVALTGTFGLIPEAELKVNDPYVGDWREAMITEAMVRLANAIDAYTIVVDTYDNLYSLISDRSTQTELAALNTAYSNLLLRERIVKSIQREIIANQARLYIVRDTHIETIRNTLWALHTNAGASITFADVECLNSSASGNLINSKYKIKYMIDISTAKPYDEYSIYTSANTHNNIIKNDSTYWQIVPQSKLATIL